MGRYENAGPLFSDFFAAGIHRRIYFVIGIDALRIIIQSLEKYFLKYGLHKANMAFI
jgi:hypothetical protein